MLCRSLVKRERLPFRRVVYLDGLVAVHAPARPRTDVRKPRGGVCQRPNRPLFSHAPRFGYDTPLY